MARTIDFGKGVVVIPIELLDGARDIDLDKAEVIVVLRPEDKMSDVAEIVRAGLEFDRGTE